MKQVIFLVISFFYAVNLQAQINVYDGSAIANPQTYGNKMQKFVNDGDNLMQQGLFENAIMAYDNALAQNENFAEALVKRAMAKHKLGREQEARTDMKQALTLSPYAGQLHGFRGTNGRLNLMAFEPIELVAQPSLDYVLDYYSDLWTDNKDEFIDSVDNIDISELDEESFLALSIQMIREHQYSKAERLLLSQEVLKAIDYDLLGLIKKQQGETQLAYNYFGLAIRKDSSYAPSYYFKSLLKTQDTKYSEALVLVEKAIAFQPDLLKAHFHKAVLLKILEKPSEALATYKNIDNEDEDLNYVLHINMAITNKILGKPLEALKHIEQAFEVSSGHDESELYKLRGNIYLMINENVSAIENYNKAIELDNNYAEAYFNRALANIIIYNKADACYDLQKCLDLGFIKAEDKMKYFCQF